MNEYKTIVFKIIPLIIIVSALVIILVEKPVWRATAITIIALMIVILLVDSNANERVISYNKALYSVKS